MLQTGFMHRQEDLSVTAESHGAVSGATILGGPSSYDEALRLSHNGAAPEECCGSSAGVVDEGDHTKCYKVGVELATTLHNSSHDDIFGDNVKIKYYKYYLEDCSTSSDLSDCTYTEIKDPDEHGHRFTVGKSRVKISATDLQGNTFECMRSVYIYDKQPPYFVNEDVDSPDHVHDEIIVEVPADACAVTNEAGFSNFAGLGFDTTAGDNCDDGVTLRKLVYSTGHIHQQEGETRTHDNDAELLYDSLTDDPAAVNDRLTPGTYQMKYMLIDDFCDSCEFPPDTNLKEWHEFNHTVEFLVVDNVPPTNISGCPADQTVEIEPDQMATTVTWTVPHVNADNCLGVGESPPPPEEINNHSPGDTFQVGTQIIKYTFKDAHDNTYPEECIFTIRVVHKNHPVNLTCPPDVVFPTLDNSLFAIVTWQSPTALQNGEILDSSHITYEPSVAPGMPFPFGETTIRVVAKGQNYTAVQEGHQEMNEDSCFFKVRVEDPQSPECDGRKYRCEAGSAEGAVKPYGICDGPDLDVQLHDGFRDTFGYETMGVVHHSELPCCTSEEGVAFQCTAIQNTATMQCLPVS